jgi:hypothetical protein
VIIDQKDIIPNFLESMKNMDFELFCHLVRISSMPSKNVLEAIGYRNSHGLERIRYEYYFGNINYKTFLKEVKKSNEQTTHKERMALKQSVDDESDGGNASNGENNGAETSNKRRS